jgi:superfamily II DNA or RNA helicase
MILRDYQSDCVESVERAFAVSSSAIVVMATGLGKTVTFAHLIARRRHLGRSIVLCHREELVRQAVEKLNAVVGSDVAVEMADEKSERHGFGKSSVVVASKDSLHKYRRTKFNPDDFATVIVDECHHATSRSFREPIDHFRQNERCRILGVTATANRHDGKALGRVFEKVAFKYDILDAVNDGWLVPIRQKIVHVESLDFRTVSKVAGDFNAGELAAIMEAEKNLHAVAAPTIDYVGRRKTLAFAVSLMQAEMLTHIFNRSRPGCATWVSGKTPWEKRKAAVDGFRRGEIQYLVNVGVFTEGFDDPGIEVIVVARPTQSCALYTQMVGRGARPLSGVVDDPTLPEGRRYAIALSAKPHLDVLDFEGNAGQHKLISTADVLGGSYDDDVKSAARKAVAASDGGMDMIEALKVAKQLKEEREEQLRLSRYKRRVQITATATYKTRDIDPFDVFDIDPRIRSQWERGEPATEKQVAYLDSKGIQTVGMTKAKASKVIGELVERRTKGKCTYNQALFLARHGYGPNLTFEDASKLITKIKNGAVA